MNRTGPWIALVLSLTSAAAVLAAESAEGRIPRDEIASTVLGAMDRNADPCTDFYRFACGGWLDATALPPDESRWTRSFSVIQDGNRELIREILEAAAADPGADPDRRRIGRFYGACMDEATVEKSGTRPLQPIFRKIEKVRDPESLLALAGWLHRRDVNVLFRPGVVPDFKNPDRNIAFFTQGGLGLPDRDYYVSEAEDKREILREYEGHVARILGMLGENPEAAAAGAAAVVAFETGLARASRPRADMRQVEKLYNKLDIGGLKELTPGLPWDAYLSGIGYPGIADINVAVPEYFQAVDRLAASTDPGAVRTYLRWQVARRLADLLPSAYVAADFEFYGKRLSGQQEIEPRWKRCVDATQDALGEVIGKVYVDFRFAGSSKQVALEMIGDIETAFENSLPRLGWMDEATRERAVEKKAAVRNKIGYPDEWRDYSRMRLTPRSYFQNALAAAAFEFDREASKVGNPVDPDEWLMSPQMVNAYYSSVRNEIAFPAGILQPPFFHRDFPAAMNYGGIGGVIGHELTHGFDDQGRKFDPTGRLEEWWEAGASERFQIQAQCVDDLYSGYEVEPGVSVNGKLTLGENIADIGGLKQAYAAYKLWEDRHGRPEPLVEGLTQEQLFFVAWGQVWCSLATPERERLQVTTDSHSPARFRVVGPISNHPAFAPAFGCDPDDPMTLPDPCEVW